MPTDSKYSHLYLKDWPFKLAATEESSKIWADRNEIYQNFEKMFKITKRTGSPKIQLVWGWLGAGKTHSLLHFWNLSRENISFMENVVVSYGTFPLNASQFLDLYRTLMEDFAFMEKIREAVNFVINYFNKNSKSSYHKEIDDKISYKLKNDFTNAIILLSQGNEQQKNLAEAWLKADPKVSLIELRKMGIYRRIEDDDDARNAIVSLIRLLCSKPWGKYEMFVWMIDEFQQIRELAKRRKFGDTVDNVIREGLLRSFKEISDNFCLLLAFSERDQDQISSLIKLPEKLFFLYNFLKIDGGVLCRLYPKLEEFYKDNNFSRLDAVNTFRDVLIEIYNFLKIKENYDIAEVQSLKQLIETINKENQLSKTGKRALTGIQRISPRLENMVDLEILNNSSADSNNLKLEYIYKINNTTKLFNKNICNKVDDINNFLDNDFFDGVNNVFELKAKKVIDDEEIFKYFISIYKKVIKEIGPKPIKEISLGAAIFAIFLDRKYFEYEDVLNSLINLSKKYPNDIRISGGYFKKIEFVSLSNDVIKKYS